MNGIIKGLIIFLAGGAIGGAVSYVVANKKANERADKEIESIRNYYENRKRVAQEVVSDIVEEVTPPVEVHKTVKITHVAPEPVDDSEPEIDEPKFVDYSKYSAPTHHRSSDLEVTEAHCPEFEYLTGSEFARSNREKISLDYYEGDSILVNLDASDFADGGNKYEDIETTIGVEALKHFGEDECDFVFVRNNKLGTDFEVYRHVEAWAGGDGPCDEGPRDE